MTFYVLTMFILHSCQVVRDVTDTVERHFSKPLPLKNMNKNPVDDTTDFSVFWVGHATTLIQIEDKVILTDPFFTNNIAAVLRRFNEPGINIGDLDQCDMILISHSHMDHLNLGSLGMLEERFPGTALLFPEGVEQFLPDYDLELYRFKTASDKNNKYIGETKIINGVKVTSVKAYHWAGRYGLDGKLWKMGGSCGYIIEYKGKTVYYSGDTSYNEEFSRYLGDNYNIDLALIPVIYSDDDKECYNDVHLYPKGLHKISDDTKAVTSIPIHYGTFTDPEKQYPVLDSMLRYNDSYKEKVKILKIGNKIILKDTYISKLKNEENKNKD